MPAVLTALFVDVPGVYSGRPDVDPWPRARDARLYPGPHPIVGHAPCERWGKLWAMGGRFGEDDGCFEAQLRAVETWGGVIEHPEGSGAWPTFGLPVPDPRGGWARRAGRPGYACHVEQGHYGHRARKPTWLYYVGPPPPALTWGPSVARAWVAGGRSLPAGMPVLGRVERRATPAPFAELLLSLARGVTRRSVAELRTQATLLELLRACSWCGRPYGEGKRSHARTCGKKCRQAAQRWRAMGRALWGEASLTAAGSVADQASGPDALLYRSLNETNPTGEEHPPLSLFGPLR